MNELHKLKKLAYKQKKICTILNILPLIFRIPWTALNIDSLKLNKLPECIPKNAEIEELSLKSNYLESIPESVKNLNGLKKLNLEGNKLTRIDPDIFEITSLTVLNLSKN